MKMPKDATPIIVACGEEVREAELRANRLLLHLRGATQECPESQGMTKAESRIIAIRVHRIVPRHPVVSTSNAESVEVGERRFRVELSARASSIWKKLALHRFHKQSTKQTQSRRHGDDDPNQRRSSNWKDARSEFFSNRSALEPLARSLWNDQSLNKHKSSRDIARSKTQQVQKQVTEPEPQFVERIDEMRLRTSSRFPRSDLEGHQADSKSGGSICEEACEHAVYQPATVEQVQTEM